MGESNSKSIGSSQKEDTDSWKTVEDVSENVDGSTSKKNLHTGKNEKCKVTDMSTNLTVKNEKEPSEMNQEPKVFKANDQDGTVNDVTAGDQLKIESKGVDVTTSAETTVHDKNTRDDKLNKGDEFKSMTCDADVSQQINDTTTQETSTGGGKNKVQADKLQKAPSKKWSFRKQGSKKSKTNKAVIMQQDQVVVVELETRDRESCSDVGDQHSLRKSSRSHDTASESTHDGKEEGKKSGKKSSRKPKSPSIFRRKSKNKSAENSSSGVAVKTSEEQKSVTTNNQTNDSREMSQTVVKKSDSSVKRVSQEQSFVLHDKKAAQSVDTCDGQRNRSKSLEPREKILIYVRESDEGKNDSSKISSVKVNNHISVPGAPQKPPRTSSGDDENKTTRPVITAESSAKVFYPVADKSTESSNRADVRYSKPSIFITPAHEAETMASLEKSQVRQTAVVTVTREVITSTTSPPEPITRFEPKGGKENKSPDIKLPSLKTSKIRRVTEEHEPNDSRTASAQVDVVPSSQKSNFTVVEVKSPASKEHKLFQVTMQTVCQKANQLHKLMTTTEDVQARLLTYHRLQLLAITDKEKEINAATRRISQALKEQVDQKLGIGLQRVADCLAEGKLQLATFQTIIDTGNQLLESGSVNEVVLKERELASQLKLLDRHMDALREQPVSDGLDSEKFVFFPGTTDNLELKSMFGELILNAEGELDSSPSRRLARGLKPQLRWSDNPWIPFFRRNANTSLTGNELMNARIRVDRCFRELTRITNMICARNFTGFVTELFQCHVDSELKMKKFCDLVVSLAAGHYHLAYTLALLCRCVSTLSVPTDGRQETRQTSRSTVLNFLDRFAMRRYQVGAGGVFLATGTTPAVSRSGSFRMLPRGDGSRRSSLSGRGSIRGSRTPQVLQLKAEPSGYGGLESGTLGSGSSSLRPPPLGGIHSTLRVDVQTLDDDHAESVDVFADTERRYSNLSLLMFVCEMFKLRLSTESAIHEWLRRLAGIDNDESAEAVCFVLFRIGRYLDHRRAQDVMNKIFVQLSYTAARKTTRGRLRAMVWDVMELREGDWLSTRTPNYWQYLIG
ncbi:hypothetical protein LSH36_135g03014 [Paralvinella palmiformis]|uniref:MIF4G domain-containing protein n=1 Tax=Paralvinella palmiformis TaxID=53620 RepID=A0AAD9JWW0_9ANNE|nr:hypothetical protein LSH36_135g03014 [Paralvinella palmiformis]